MHKENTSPKLLARKTRGADFCEFVQPAGFQDWIFLKSQQTWLQ